VPTGEIVIRYAGDCALLVETAGPAAAHLLRAAIEDAAPPGVRETVVGARSLLVLVDPLDCDLASVRRIAAATAVLSGGTEVRTPAPPDKPAGARRIVRVPVRYDGADLGEVAALTGLAAEEVVRRHAAATYTVAFTGFAPGFGYLTGLDPALRVPRRDSPRERVPAGSVAIAGGYTAVYPRPTPGGWRLLGHTVLEVFDAARTPPALLAPGDLVRFEPPPDR
jgi:KipI family sensor histidine kinase inhibitor